MVRLLLALCVCIQEAVLDHAMPETPCGPQRFNISSSVFRHDCMTLSPC